MDQPDKTFTSEGTGARNWIGGIIVAVILGEAIWSLIVSVMNNLVVPWLGDVMGQSSGLPTSFTQRPYNYPDLFVSVVEFCIAGIVAAILNFFFQRPGARRVRPVKSVISTVPVEGARVVSQAPAQLAMTGATSPGIPRVPPVKTDPVNPPAASVIPATPVPLVGPAPVSKPVAVAPSVPPADSAVKPVPSAPKAEPPKLVPAKPKKPKEVYYNIVGEPVSSDED